MVRTGRRIGVLVDRLERLGHRRVPVPPPPRLADLPADLRDSVMSLYASLGGLEPVVLRPGAWDLAFDGFVVEHHEEFHFNRYRRASLELPWAAALPWQSDYLRFCDEHEQACIAGGQRWTNASCERMFGPAEPVGTFATTGAPRWKQRAVYDVMKDALAASGAIRLCRLSIYDVPADDEELRSLVTLRTAPGTM